MPEEVRKITIQPNIGYTVDPYGILIGKSKKFFLVDLSSVEELL